MIIALPSFSIDTSCDQISFEYAEATVLSQEVEIVFIGNMYNPDLTSIETVALLNPKLIIKLHLGRRLILFRQDFGSINKLL